MRTLHRGLLVNERQKHVKIVSAQSRPKMTRMTMTKLVPFLENSLREFSWDCEHCWVPDTDATRQTQSDQPTPILNTGPLGIKCLNFANKS